MFEFFGGRFFDVDGMGSTFLATIGRSVNNSSEYFKSTRRTSTGLISIGGRLVGITAGGNPSARRKCLSLSIHSKCLTLPSRVCFSVF